MSEENSPSPPPPSHHGLKPGFHTPQRTSAIGMYLFLASLFMLFASGLFGYVIIRANAAQKFSLGSLRLPPALWISTILVVVGSFTIQRAVHEVRRERQRSFRNWMAATLLIAIVFVIVQAPSMLILLSRQQAMRQRKLALYGLVFFLILLHALHVLGGIIALLRTSRRAARGVYDHEHFQPVRHVALYWHFLDAVWLAMFFTFLLMG
ncbi:MAG TPA: heme-copper oxidase subunit III [Tepidisphaeraceae bacterium]|jgi:heme/copper-type cytochrome/quinol oxidase subunit 3|nr:heme-copper oxidase subunit III [Tepidisphaeraceae bacterium]